MSRCDRYVPIIETLPTRLAKRFRAVCRSDETAISVPFSRSHSRRAAFASVGPKVYYRTVQWRCLDRLPIVHTGGLQPVYFVFAGGQQLTGKATYPVRAESAPHIKVKKRINLIDKSGVLHSITHMAETMPPTAMRQTVQSNISHRITSHFGASSLLMLAPSPGRRWGMGSLKPPGGPIGQLGKDGAGH